MSFLENSILFNVPSRTETESRVYLSKQRKGKQTANNFNIFPIKSLGPHADPDKYIKKNEKSKETRYLGIFHNFAINSSS